MLKRVSGLILASDAPTPCLGPSGLPGMRRVFWLGRAGCVCLAEIGGWEPGADGCRAGLVDGGAYRGTGFRGVGSGNGLRAARSTALVGAGMSAMCAGGYGDGSG